MTAPHPHAVPVFRERPILFSAPMVRAILAGTKTQTRRLVKPQPAPRGSFVTSDHVFDWCERDDIDRIAAPAKALRAAWHRQVCSYGQPGDRLWVREAFAEFSVGEGLDRRVPTCVAYRATCGDNGEFDYVNTRGEIMGLRVAKWTPSIHMPRWASRITLEVTEVRVERLQDISHEDALAEGTKEWAKDRGPFEPREQRLSIAQIAFSHLWDEVNGPGAWERNDWVWCVSFRRLAP